ncbi:hypothetical protein FF125_15190 [Aureibaculum algae]|uniref:Uncharacterized protein n=1 Tax=Aureibaculum algae TaxID=2584122 RepID=A0A5B7TWK4_9FLAO|nr:hypothetical protein [Aureibaculum algae]QCX39723.1 hypothetical protein FF125_15190 [Aureibaculum algae]
MMKKHRLKLTLLLLVVLVISCTEGGTMDGVKIELTSKNYVDVALIETNYYKGKIADVQVELDSLQNILDAGQGDSKTQLAFDSAIELEQSLNSSLNDVKSVVGIDIEPDWPIPPNPCILGNICLPDGIRFIVAPRVSNIKFVGIYNTKGELIDGSKGELSPMPGYEDKIIYKEVNFGKFKGDIFIRMETIEGNSLEVQGVIY